MRWWTNKRDKKCGGFNPVKSSESLFEFPRPLPVRIYVLKKTYDQTHADQRLSKIDAVSQWSTSGFAEIFFASFEKVKVSMVKVRKDMLFSSQEQLFGCDWCWYLVDWCNGWFVTSLSHKIVLEIWASNEIRQACRDLSENLSIVIFLHFTHYAHRKVACTVFILKWTSSEIQKI